MPNSINKSVKSKSFIMIKKTVSIISVVLLSVSLVYGQENMVEKKFRFGLKLAPAALWYKPGSSETSSDGLKPGFAYGLMADYLLSDNYSISSGIEMLLMTSKYSIETPANGIIPAVTSNFAAKYQFIQLPVSIKMKSNEIGSFRYFGKFGFNNAICYKSTADININGTTKKNNDNSSNVNNLRFGLSIGGGAEYNLSGSTNIIAGIYFDNGFLNMNKTNGKLYSRGIVLDLGVVF